MSRSIQNKIKLFGERKQFQEMVFTETLLKGPEIDRKK